MLRAIVDQVSSWDETESIAADLRIGSFDEREKAGLDHLMVLYSMKFRQLSRMLSTGVGMIPAELRAQVRWVAERDVDVVLDASGFALSDQWGPKMAVHLGHKIEEARRRGARVIMLPQAFGPFERPDVRDACQKVLDQVDLVFAREQQSYDYLIDLGISASKVRIAPDFTNSLHVKAMSDGVGPSPVSVQQPYACVVPNYRMVDMTADGVEDTYIAFLCDTVKMLFANGLDVKLLLHTTNPNDAELGNTVCSRTDADLLAPSDALDVKRIIGGSECVVSSRFHGLVNALSQGVPAAATGWSHKYQYLMQEYACEDFLVSMDAEAEKQQAEIRALVEKRESLRERIETAGIVQRQRTEEMWSEVRATANM